MRLGGIDPGINKFAFSFVDVPCEGKYQVASWHKEPDKKSKQLSLVPVPGHFFQTPSTWEIEDRLNYIFKVTRGVIQKYKPDAIAYERLLGIPGPSSIKVTSDIGQAYGAIIAGCLAEGYSPKGDHPLKGYYPSHVKSVVSSKGNAKKAGMMLAVENILCLDQTFVEYHGALGADHVADAFAMAICYAVDELKWPVSVSVKADSIVKGGMCE